LWPTRIPLVSENTVTFNLLHDIIERLQRKHGGLLTVIAPTPRQESIYGFDAVIQDLPPGVVLAFQFKRPVIHRTYSASFTVRRDQCNKLARWFLPRQACYAFAPYPLIQGFLNNRNIILDHTTFADPHNMLGSWRGKASETRTVGYVSPPGSHQLMITDPGRYVDLKSYSWGDIQETVFEYGMRIPLSDEERKRISALKEKLPFGGFGKTYYVHVSEPPLSPEHSAATKYKRPSRGNTMKRRVPSLS